MSPPAPTQLVAPLMSPSSLQAWLSVEGLDVGRGELEAGDHGDDEREDQAGGEGALVAGAIEEGEEAHGPEREDDEGEADERRP